MRFRFSSFIDKKLILKTITYRMLGSMTSMCIGFFATKSFTIGVSIGAADLLVKPIIYYFHELLWRRFPRSVKTTTAP